MPKSFTQHDKNRLKNVFNLSNLVKIKFCRAKTPRSYNLQLINIVIWQVHFVDSSMSEVSANSGDKESGK